jgi:hypothetical protein
VTDADDLAAVVNHLDLQDRRPPPSAGRADSTARPVTPAPQLAAALHVPLASSPTLPPLYSITSGRPTRTAIDDAIDELARAGIELIGSKPGGPWLLLAALSGSGRKGLRTDHDPSRP